MQAQRSLFHDMTPTIDEIMAVWHGENEWLTRKEIADRLARAKSPTLVAMLHVAVGAGFLTYQTVTLPNHVEMFQYSPTADWLNSQEPY